MARNAAAATSPAPTSKSLEQRVADLEEFQRELEQHPSQLGNFIRARRLELRQRAREREIAEAAAAARHAAFGERLAKFAEFCEARILVNPRCPGETELALQKAYTSWAAAQGLLNTPMEMEDGEFVAAITALPGVRFGETQRSNSVGRPQWGRTGLMLLPEGETAQQVKERWLEQDRLQVERKTAFEEETARRLQWHAEQNAKDIADRKRKLEAESELAAAYRDRQAMQAALDAQAEQPQPAAK
ncbi:MAG: hypothetical protein ABFC96_03740 [Thermoguttaceae bacterium]